MKNFLSLLLFSMISSPTFGQQESAVWVCRNGESLPSRSDYCNGVSQCMDNSDEANCAFCPSGWRCDDSWWCTRQVSDRCDGVEDCNDGSDELNCPEPLFNSDNECTVNDWQCRDGKCASSRNVLYCDGITDCLDGSDESDCDVCNRGFYCSAQSFCTEFVSDRCDGKNDCNDGSDEYKCLKSTGIISRIKNFLAIVIGGSIAGLVLLIALPIAIIIGIICCCCCCCCGVGGAAAAAGNARRRKNYTSNTNVNATNTGSTTATNPADPQQINDYPMNAIV